MWTEKKGKTITDTERRGSPIIRVVTITKTLPTHQGRETGEGRDITTRRSLEETKPLVKGERKSLKRVRKEYPDRTRMDLLL